MKVPNGFTFSGLHAGIKPNRKDLALVVSDTPCAAAGTFTINEARAAPVRDAEARLPSEDLRAVIVNSGNANALTGPQGLKNVSRVHAATAAALGIDPSAVVSASTGVIGMPLPAQKIVDALPALVRGLDADPLSAAEAIMTTDTRVKMAFRTLVLDGKEITLSALCKGSGMIAPQLATMIAVIVTDCAISARALDGALKQVMTSSFNSLVVDGDMSTNDAVFALANGKAANPRIDGEGPQLSAFTAALRDLCIELARDIAEDGEGATHLFEVTVSQAPTEAIARDLAKSIAASSLVKAAIFGADPNWGRILATVGARAGSQGFPVDPAGARVVLQDVTVYDGGPVLQDAAGLRRKLRAPEVSCQVALGAGEWQATAWGCDLSYDYVKINADYTSLIVPGPDGGVAKDDRLANYSPSFKTSLLVEALSYISRFAGKRCVVKYGGAAMLKESLKQSFCEDINLLRSAGLLPIIVHGGGPEITRTLEKLGRKAEFVGDVRVTDASDMKVVEMVLTGSINTELVTLLNRSGGHAVGVSGKDGALLRARKRTHESGRDLGQVGEITSVNTAFLQMLLAQGYVPIISPIGIGEDGQSYNLNADAVAAEIAGALASDKLIYLTDVPGILEGDELVTELTASALRARLESGAITGGMIAKSGSILKALSAGVQRVHVIDGRTPHSVIAELFTDRGVGTLIQADEAPPCLWERASARDGSCRQSRPEGRSNRSRSGVGMPNDHDVRRAAIRRIIASERVATQEALRKRVFEEGFDVTQATLSRDLAHLGARRVSLPEGGTMYELDEARVPGGMDALSSQRGIVTNVLAADALVVVKTLAGAASAVALAIDRARLEEIAGTLAGDDTIFIAPSKGVPASRVAQQLTSLWLEGSSR